MDYNRFYDLDIQLKRQLFFSEKTSFGIARVEVINGKDSNIVDSELGEITLKGSMPELEQGITYTVKVQPKSDAKYGLGYEVKFIYANKFMSRNEQEVFLKSFVSAKQVETIFNAYDDENILDLIAEEKIDVEILKGIGKKTIEKIKEKVKENEKYRKSIVELTCKYEIPYNAIKRLTDSYGSPDILLKKVNENPYILTEVDGFGFKKVDDIAKKIGVEHDSKVRIIASLKHHLYEYANSGHCWVLKDRVTNDIVNSITVSRNVIEKCLSELDSSYIKIEDDRVYLTRYKAVEERIASDVKRIASFKPLVDEKESIVKSSIKMVEEQQGFSFTDEQQKAIQFAINENFLVIDGKAGTGKTSLVKGIVNVLKAVGDYSIGACAFSGKASQRIEEATGFPSSTIHRILNYNPMSMSFSKNEFDPLEQDIIIIDEASMINSVLFSDLLRAVRDGAKVIILGDDGQLESIGVGAVLTDLINSKTVKSIRLTKVHRQAQMSGILSSANMVYDGENFVRKDESGFKRLGELKDLYMYSFNERNKIGIINQIAKIAQAYEGDVLEFQIITTMRERGDLSTLKINNVLQKIFNKSPEDVEDVNKVDRKKYSLLVGDKVIQNVNNYDLDVYNGTVGIIQDIDMSRKGSEVIVNFNGKNYSYKKEMLNQIELAYALTVFKFQGSQSDFVVFTFDYASYVMLNRQLVYTGMTRAKKALFMMVENRALDYAIKTDRLSKRNTFLGELI